MKITYFTESLFPHVDGVSLTLARLFHTLERRGIGLRVVSPFVPDDSVSWSGRVRGVRSVAFPPYPDYRVSLPVGHGLAPELDRYAPDLVHVVSPTPMAVWAQRWAHRRGVPVVASFHTHFVSYFRYYGVAPLERLGWAWLRWFYDRCAAVYAPSESIIGELEARGIERARLWSRGIDAERFSPERRDPALRERLGADVDTPILLFVSRLVEEKDVRDLVEMARLLRAGEHSFRFVLVGDGPMRAELEQALPQAHFAGHRTGDELARYYASADVFVFPSTTETFGNVVLEALASGLPAVVADRGGPPGQITPRENGLIARANDPADLARTVGQLLSDREDRERMGRRARKRAATRDWATINSALIDDYERVLGEHGAAVA